MKKLALLFISILVFTCQEKPSKNAPLKKTYESIKIERYAVENGNKDSSSLSSYILKFFDNKGQEIKSIYYGSNDSITMQFINQFENGNKTKVEWVNAKDQRVRYVNMTYNEDNQLIKSETFKPSGEFQSGFIHKWKDDGRIEEKGPIVEGKPFKPNSIYTYNKQQEFESLIEFDENDNPYGTFKWKYLKYNKEKEWIERQMLFNDTLVRIEKRIISYKEI